MLDLLSTPYLTNSAHTGERGHAIRHHISEQHLDRGRPCYIARDNGVTVIDDGEKRTDNQGDLLCAQTHGSFASHR